MQASGCIKMSRKPGEAQTSDPNPRASDSSVWDGDQEFTFLTSFG